MVDCGAPLDKNCSNKRKDRGCGAIENDELYAEPVRRVAPTVGDNTAFLFGIDFSLLYQNTYIFVEKIPP